jgi:O-antigen ligase
MYGTVPSPLPRLERWLHTVFLLALFCVPFATALTNLWAVLCLVGFLVLLALEKDVRAALRTPPALLALALLALYVAGCAWSIAPQDDIGSALRNYSRLLILPVGVTLSVRAPGLARRALYAYLGGAAVLALACYLVWFDAMPSSSLGWWRVGGKEDAFAFKNHITVGILLAFSAAACALAGSYANGGRRLAWAAGLVGFSIPIVFLNQGRTGYVALFIGLAVVLLLRARRGWLGAAGGLAALTLLFAVLYATSDNFRLRTDQLVHEIATDKAQSPNGVRLSYLLTGLRMVAEHPLIGQGTASFAEAYAPTARRIWAGYPAMSEARHQPHSEVLLVTVQLGVVGLAVYLALLGSIARAGLLRRTLDSDLLLLLCVIYASTSLFNSLLWDITEAYWFLLLGGALYAAALRAASAGHHGKESAWRPA